MTWFTPQILVMTKSQNLWSANVQPCHLIITNFNTELYSAILTFSAANFYLRKLNLERLLSHVSCR